MTGPALAMAVVAMVVLAAGCEEDQSASPPPESRASTTAELVTRKGVVGRQPRRGRPETAPGARVMTLPDFGTLRVWPAAVLRRPAPTAPEAPPRAALGQSRESLGRRCYS